MTAPALHIPFWVPIVAPTLSNSHLSAVLPSISATRLSTLRPRYGIPDFVSSAPQVQSINWLALLGQIEDESLAELVTSHFKVLITAALVAAIRNDLGISAFSARKPKLEPSIRELVGRYTAINISKGWGVSVNVIEAYRQLSGGAAPDSAEQAPPLGKWKQEWIELFGHQTNAQIARATGNSAREVRAMRNTLRIVPPTTRTYWRLVSEDELAIMSDEQLCELHGGPLADYAAQRLELALADKAMLREIKRSKRLPLQHTHFLSQMPIKRLAKLSGVSEFHLKHQRDELGMEPYSPFPTQFETLLSTCPDAEVAERTHTAVSTVKYRRDKLGKPAYSPPKGK